MNLESWLPFYERIIQHFGFDREKDEESCRIMSVKLLDPLDIDSLKPFRNRRADIFGGAPSLNHQLSKTAGSLQIVAGSAITRYYEKFGPPDIIVTDLDDDYGLTAKCLEEGTVAFIHAHGDNIPLIRSFNFPRKSMVFGTCQCKPFLNTLNFGGFTDGDRAVFLADFLDSPRIKLHGFDFTYVQEATPERRVQKAEKLIFARELIDEVYKSRISKFGSDNLVIL